jgi:uncharacterized protein
MLIDLTRIANSEEKIIQTEVPYEAENFSSALGDFPIIDRTQVLLTIQNKGDQELRISGGMSFQTVIPCDRCLVDVPTKIQLDFEKEVDLKHSASERMEELDEQNFIEGYSLDVEKLVYGEILVNWPMKVLCKDDCKGLCSTCGVNLNQKTCDCDSTDLDPRMARIRDIFSNFKEV